MSRLFQPANVLDFIGIVRRREAYFLHGAWHDEVAMDILQGERQVDTYGQNV